MEKKVCSICGKEFTGWGNNAWPVNNGTCCDECNKIVIAARILDLNAKRVVDCLDFEEVEEGMAQLRSFKTCGLITDELYNHIIKNWDRLILAK